MRREPIPLVNGPGALLTFLIVIAIVFTPESPPTLIRTSWFYIGIASCAIVLSYVVNQVYFGVWDYFMSHTNVGYVKDFLWKCPKEPEKALAAFDKFFYSNLKDDCSNNEQQWHPKVAEYWQNKWIAYHLHFQNFCVCFLFSLLYIFFVWYGYSYCNFRTDYYRWFTILFMPLIFSLFFYRSKDQIERQVYFFQKAMFSGFSSKIEEYIDNLNELK